MSDSNNTIRWGIIGCGSVTEVKSGPAYQQTQGFELLAVMRRDRDKAQDYAQRHGVSKFYDQANNLIDDPDVDAIYIATPPDSHKELALMVAAAGKPCCIEKPLAPTHEECCAIVSAFAANNIPLFVAYYRRSLPRFEKVKNIFDSGKIGSVRHIHWQLHKTLNAWDKSRDYNWRTDKKIARAGYFDDLASHGLDLFAFYFGDYQQAHGIAKNQQGLYSAYDAVTASWLHSNGITGSGFWNFGCSENADQAEIVGSEGKILFSVFDEKPIRIITAHGEETIHIPNPHHVQLPHVKKLRDALLHQIPHPSTGASALQSSWVMEEILKKN
ncbi:MAG: Gfo/Idh/MocA family oxidoreductase [Sphingobacteriales bacterium]|nr:MAG: Gfo/Idh/MocA family oxidoreductase [Sphingobacteriales bacterium]